jgi:hypothetical protein
MTGEFISFAVWQYACVDPSVAVAEENALLFENDLREESLRIGSPLNAGAVMTTVDHVPVLPNVERIFYEHYNAKRPSHRKIRCPHSPRARRSSTQ